MTMEVISNKLRNDDVLPVRKGGTGGHDEDEASDNLQYMRRYEVNEPDGIVELDASGHINSTVIPSGIARQGILIDGPIVLYVDSGGSYRIVGYSRFNSYTVSISVGTIVRNNGDLTVTAPSFPSEIIITVNGVQFVVQVMEPA